MPVFSRTVVTAAEILRTLPPDEDSMYTVRGKPREAASPATRCRAGIGTDHHCPASAETDGLCIPHWTRRSRPRKTVAWDAPLRRYGNLRS